MKTWVCSIPTAEQIEVLKKGSMCRVVKSVSGGKPIVTVHRGDSVLILKHYGAGYFKVYCAKVGSKLTMHIKQMELIAVGVPTPPPSYPDSMS